jgi:hypothetical protein
MDYSIIICFDSQVKQLFPFLVVFYSTLVILYPNEQSYTPNDSANIEKHINTFLLNTCAFNINPGNQGSPMIFLASWGGVRLSPLSTSATNWPIVPAPDDRWWWMWSSKWNENWQGKQQYSEKTCPSATLPTTNPTWIDMGSNPGRCRGKPATNRLSYGTAWPRGLRHELSSLVRIPLDAWIFVYVYSVFVLSCVGSSLATGWSPFQGDLPTVLGLRIWNETKSFMDAVYSKVG